MAEVRGGGVPAAEYEAGDTEPTQTSQRLPMSSETSVDAAGDLAGVMASGGSGVVSSVVSGRLSSRGRVASTFLYLGPTLGCVALYVLFFCLDLAAGADIAIFGVRDAATEQRIFARYGSLIWREQARIVGIYAAIGLVVGAGAQILSWLWDRVGARRLLMTVGLALGFHLWQVMHTIARLPQLYTESLYDRGGVRRAIMVALTHYIPSSLVDGLALGTGAGLLLGPFLTVHGRRHIARGLRRLVPGLSRARPQLSRAVVTAVCLLALVPLCLRLLAGPSGQAAASASPPPAAGTGAGSAMDPTGGETPTAEPPPAAPVAGGAAEHPSVLVLAVDSLRADRVDGGREARAVAPHIAALADRGVRFDQAFVTVPRTFPSFVTLLTGRYPHHHGIRTMFPSASERTQVGPALPGALHHVGYDTRVFSDFCGEIFSRIDLGFGRVEVPLFDVKTIVRQRGVTIHPNLMPYVDGMLGRRLFPSLEALAELSDPDLLADAPVAALRELASSKTRRPFFMTVFFSSAHFPYSAPAPYYRRFTDPDYRGPFRYHKPPWADSALTPADEQQVRGLYNGAVAAADAAIGRVLGELSRLGLAKDTIVVLLADHGENLYDEPGRGMGHGDHLEGPHSLQIPLIIYDPVHAFPPHVVPGLVRDIDLAPTLLSLTGQPADTLPVDGTGLMPLLRGERADLGLTSFSETELWFTPAGPGFDPDNRLPYPGVTATTDVDPSDDIFLSERWRDLVTVAKHRALRTSRWKLIYRPTRTGVHWSLYDLVADPRELRDVSARQPRELNALQGDLLRFLAADPKAVVEGGYVIPQ